MKSLLAFHQHWRVIVFGAVLLVAGIALYATQSRWLPILQKYASPLARHDAAGGDHDHDHDGDHDAHEHGHVGHVEDEALELSDVAWKNIGLKTGVVNLQDYVKTVSVPAMVTERAGRTQIDITALMTGVVTEINVTEGEAIKPGQTLFTLRLTHEDLVTAQRDFLQAAEELDVVRKEIDRLQRAGEGTIAGRRVVEQQYEQQKLEAALRAQHQGLLLHGLSDEHIETILKTRKLLQSLSIFAPPFTEEPEHHAADHLYHVQKIAVNRGQQVAAGDPLGVLADHCMLYVQGQAFEDDAEMLTQAAREGWLLDVVPVSNREESVPLSALKIIYVADHIDSESRALPFYLSLPNELVRDQPIGNRRVVTWKYRPGQRMEVKIPLGQAWKDQIVLPPGAVVEEGAEAFVFEQNGDHFDRIPVHIIYRDQRAVVVENDGRLIGSTLALSGAYQMHLALKNKAGGGIDPHAGHQH